MYYIINDNTYLQFKPSLSIHLSLLIMKFSELRITSDLLRLSDQVLTKYVKHQSLYCSNIYYFISFEVYLPLTGKCDPFKQIQTLSGK